MSVDYTRHMGATVIPILIGLLILSAMYHADMLSTGFAGIWAEFKRLTGRA